MTISVAGILLAMAQAAGASAPAAPQPPALTGTISQEQAAAVLSQCGSRRFETAAEGIINGKPRRTRLQLCATPSDTTEQWIAKLQKSADSVRAQAGLPSAMRDKLIADLNTEIARVRSSQPMGSIRGPAMGTAGIAGRPILPKTDFAVSALPPMPNPRSDVSPTRVLVGGGAMALAPAAKRPAMTIRCAARGSDPADCGFMQLDETFVVTASENLDSPVTLKFSNKRGSKTAEVPLGQLRAGQVVRLAVPKELCGGVVRTTFSIEIVGTGAGGPGYYDKQGPFDRRCA